MGLSREARSTALSGSAAATRRMLAESALVKRWRACGSSSGSGEMRGCGTGHPPFVERERSGTPTECRVRNGTPTIRTAESDPGRGCVAQPDPGRNEVGHPLFAQRKINPDGAARSSGRIRAESADQRIRAVHPLSIQREATQTGPRIATARTWDTHTPEFSDPIPLDFPWPPNHAVSHAASMARPRYQRVSPEVLKAATTTTTGQSGTPIIRATGAPWAEVLQHEYVIPKTKSALTRSEGNDGQAVRTTDRTGPR